MDLSKQRDGHKTSRFCIAKWTRTLVLPLPCRLRPPFCVPPDATDGPFAASLPGALTPVLNQYTAVLELEPGSDAGPYLFHPPQSHFDRPMEPSAWTGWVRRLFKRHHGEVRAASSRLPLPPGGARATCCCTCHSSLSSSRLTLPPRQEVAPKVQRPD